MTLRDETEWIELVEGGYNFLVGTNIDLLIQTVKGLQGTFFPQKTNLFGEGTAGEIICKNILS